MTEREVKIIEPLAKFHAETDTQGRFYLPKATCKRYNIHINDYVELLVRFLNENSITFRAHVFVRVASNRLIHLPKALREQANGDRRLIEVLLINHYTPDDLLSPIGKTILNLFKSKYRVLSPEEEKQILQKSIER